VIVSEVFAVMLNSATWLSVANPPSKKSVEAQSGPDCQTQ